MATQNIMIDQTTQKLHNLLQGLLKQLNKQCSQTLIQSIQNSLDAVTSEIGFILQYKDLNDISLLINKLTVIWKEIIKVIQKGKNNELDNELNDKIQQQELISSVKKQIKDGYGDIGFFGGAKVSTFQSPPSKNYNRQLSRQQTGLPSISSQNYSDQKRTNYEIDESQREILQEVLKQNNKLNVQIVMKRYDPKITLFYTQGTDTNEDIQDAMRNFNRDQLDNKLYEVMLENQKNIKDLQKALGEKKEISSIHESQAQDKLKSIYKTVYTKTIEIDQILSDAYKSEPVIFNDIMDDFITHIQTNYHDIQNETYKIVATLFQQQQLKLKQEELLKSKTLQVQQPTHKKDKLSQGRRANNNSSTIEEQSILDKTKQELIDKKMELDKKNIDLQELQQKIRQLESQLVQTSLELETVKGNLQKVEQEKNTIQFEFRKIEKQVASKTFLDQAIQCVDIGQQHLLAKLQKENSELQKLIYQLKGELNKASPTSNRELNQQNTQYVLDKSDEQIIQNSYNGTPQQSRFRSTYDLDLNIANSQHNLDDAISIDQKISNSQRNGDISNKDSIYEDFQFDRQQSFSQNAKSERQRKKSTNLVEAKQQQVSSPQSNSERQVQLPKQLSVTQFNQKKKQQKSILQIEEEESMMLNQSDIQRSKYKHQTSIKNKINIRQTSVELEKKKEILKSKSFRDQEDTQPGTTNRASSGIQIQTERSQNKLNMKNNGRRIQTEQLEQNQQNEQEKQFEQNFKYQRSTTQKEQKKNTNINSNQKKNYSSSQKIYSKANSVTSKNEEDDENMEIINNQKMEDIETQTGGRLKNPNSPIRRSSTSGPQQLKMIIKLNDQDQEQYTTYWHQRHIEKEVQTDFQLLMDVINEIIQSMDIPQTIKTNIQSQIIQKLQNNEQNIDEDFIVSKQNNKFQISQMSQHSYSNLQDQILESNTPKTLRISNEKRNSIGRKSTISNSSEQLKQIFDNNIQQQQQQQQTEKKQIINKQLSSISNKSYSNQKLQLEQSQQVKQKEEEQILQLDTIIQNQEQELSFEELQKKIQYEDNNGQQLEKIKPNDLNTESFMKKMYNTISNKTSNGVLAVKDLIHKYYKKGNQEQVTYQEFKMFYHKLTLIHQQCGYNLNCLHLQRFIMKLGFTSIAFSQRKLLKTSLSILKPFDPLTTTKQKLISSQSTTHQAQKFQTQQYFQSAEI